MSPATPNVDCDDYVGIQSDGCAEDVNARNIRITDLP
jgi:hypothetical protein